MTCELSQCPLAGERGRNIGKRAASAEAQHEKPDTEHCGTKEKVPHGGSDLSAPQQNRTSMWADSHWLGGHQSLLRVKSQNSVWTSCWGALEQPPPFGAGLLTCGRAGTGCTCNGSRSWATLSRPASVLSVFIRLFCYVNRLWGWEQLDVIKLQPPSSESPWMRHKNQETDETVKDPWQCTCRGGEVTGWGSSEEAKGSWPQSTCILVTWTPHMWTLRFHTTSSSSSQCGRRKAMWCSALVLNLGSH